MLRRHKLVRSGHLKKTINFSSFSLLTGYSVAPVSYKIDQGAEIVYPSSLTLLGTRCTFEGLVVGVHRLVVAEGADVVFASTTQTGVSVNQSINQSINQLPMYLTTKLMHPSATFPLAISICLKLVMFNFINSSMKFVWP